MVREMSEFPPSCGIWPFSSRINHCCYSNAYRSFIGHIQITRATCDIPVNTEVTFWYKIPYIEGHNTAEQDLRRWGFECCCTICVADKNTKKTIFTRRKNLLRDLKAVFATLNKPDLAKAKRFLAELEKTHDKPATRVPRLALWKSYLLLVRHHAGEGRSEEVIDSALKLLATLGFVFEGSLVGNADSDHEPFRVTKWGMVFIEVIEVWTLLERACRVSNRNMCGALEAYARLTFKMCKGEDETFVKSLRIQTAHGLVYRYRERVLVMFY